jgi:hypothetical protein
MISSLPGRSLLLPLTPFGRFPTLRRIYSYLMSFQKRPTLRFHPNNIEAAGAHIAKSWSTYFPTELIGACVSDLRETGISQRLHLPEGVVNSVIEFANQMPYRDLNGRSRFQISELERDNAASDLSGLRGICTDIAGSPHIINILSDYVLCQIATLYLGYEPRSVEAYLEVLLTPRAPAADGSYAPFEYHYDVPGFNFIGFFFYLSDVDHTTGGAHAIILNSNRDKPLRFMLQSARTAGRQVFEYYKREDELAIYGQKGRGFVEDLYAFHKVSRPETKDRLALHIRYY